MKKTRTKKSRATRFPRFEDELPPGFNVVEEASKLRLGLDYVLVGPNEYAFTEKIFAQLEASARDQGLHSGESEASAGAASNPDDKAAPAAPVGYIPPEGGLIPEFLPDSFTPNPAYRPQEELRLSRFGVPPTSASEQERHLIVQKLVPNTRILLATARPIDGKIYHVFVGNSTLYVVGMPLNAVPHPQEQAFWKAIGMPTTKGRW